MFHSLQLFSFTFCGSLALQIKLRQAGNVTCNAMTTLQTKTKLLLIGLSLHALSCNQTTKTSEQTIQNNDTTKMYPEKFDRTKLTADDNAILADFATRRKSFDRFIKENNLKLFTCPGCGFPTLDERGGYDICDVCNWEDDNQDDENADDILGGPNSNLSLTQNRLDIGKTLKLLADSLQGKVNDNPNEVISILTNHDKRMKLMSDKIPETADISDPLWTEYKQASKKVLNDLIKR